MNTKGQEIKWQRQLQALKRAKCGIGISKDTKKSYLENGGDLENESEIAAKLRKIKDPLPKKDPPEEVSFPWFIFSVALINDLIDYIDPILHAVTAGVWLGISETIGNMIDWTCWLILTSWTFFTRARSNPLTKFLFGLIVESVPFGDFIPTWTILVLSYYLKEKHLARSASLSKSVEVSA